MNSPVEMLLRWRTLATHRVHTLPVLVVMPHQGCNCRCGMCDLWRPRGEGPDLSREDLAGQIEALRRLRVRRVVLSGGEALLHRDLWGLADLLRQIPAGITLLSNGLLLQQHVAEVVRGCDQVVVSLDGAPGTHDAIRGVPGALDRLAKGVAALKSQASLLKMAETEPQRHQDTKTHQGILVILSVFVPWWFRSPSSGLNARWWGLASARTDLRITARCVLQRGNFRELSEIVETARRIGLDQISFLAVDVSTSAFARSEPWRGERADAVTLDPEEVVEFAATLERTIADRAGDFASGFIAEPPQKLRRLVRYFAALNGDGDFPPTVCNAPWVSAVVEPDGTVRPCFFQRPLGNLRDRPLGSILNSAEAIDFRRGLDVRRDPLCRRCVCTLYVGPRTVV